MSDKIQDIFRDDPIEDSTGEYIDRMMYKEASTRRGAEFAEMWGVLVKTAMEDGWDVAARRAEFALSEGGLREGHRKAASLVLDAPRREMDGMYQFIKEAMRYEREEGRLEKFASKAMTRWKEADPTPEDIGWGGAGYFISEKGVPLQKLAWRAPILSQMPEDDPPGEPDDHVDPIRAWEDASREKIAHEDPRLFGRKAALRDLQMIAKNGGTVSELCKRASKQVDRPLEKCASAREENIELGIRDTMAHCLKIASGAAKRGEDMSAESLVSRLSATIEKNSGDRK